jgi:hypothetical protein
MRLAFRINMLRGSRADEYYWHDLGTADHIAHAARALKRGMLSP